MLGWMGIFALMFLVGLWATLAGDPSGASLSLKLATVLSGTLLFACVITRVVRGRA